MSSPCKKLPKWLSNAYNDSHIAVVLQILADRELRRERLRSISRYQAKQSHITPTGSPDSPHGNVPQEHCEYYSVAVACHERNVHHNRYVDILPYDRTRVVVGHQGDNGPGRYLNANWVLERFGHKWWIATQAPLPTTAHAFLSVILQPVSKPPNALSLLPVSQGGSEAVAPSYEPSRVRTVVQLTRNVERGRSKAHAYFPSEVGKSLIIPADPGSSIPALKVTLLQTHNHEAAKCIRSTVTIAPIHSASQVQSNSSGVGDGDRDGDGDGGYNDQRIIFRHLLYTAWPDHGVPEEEDRASLLAFLKLVDETNRDTSQNSYSSHDHQQKPELDPPIMVGCSAGIGRTGSFIALSSLLRHNGVLLPTANPTPASNIPPSPLGPLPEELAGDLVAEEIDSLREQRPRMVERPEQTLLIYELLIDGLQNT